MAFEGIRPVLHLPFDDPPEQAVREAELVALVGSMLAFGVDGLVVLGLASESWSVTESERDRLVEIVAEAIGDRVPLVVGLDGTTAVAADRGRRAVERGASGLMVLPPRQAVGRAALVGHFTTLADAVQVPLLIQDSPQLTGVVLDVETIVSMGRHPLVRSLKSEVPGAGAKVSAVHGAGLEVVAGWGGLGYLEQLERGAIGCMPGCDLGPALLAIDRTARSGDMEEALRVYRLILPLLAFETASLDLLVLSAKRHLRRQGTFSSHALRAPARVLDELESRTLDGLLDELAAAGVPGFEVRS